MNTEPNNINEDSVGTVLPITQPDEVLRKDEIKEPTPDEAFDAIDPSLLAGTKVNSTSSFDNGKPMVGEEDELETEPTSLDNMNMMESASDYSTSRSLLLFYVSQYQSQLRKLSPDNDEKTLRHALQDAQGTLAAYKVCANNMDKNKEYRTSAGPDSTLNTETRFILGYTMDAIKNLDPNLSDNSLKKAYNNIKYCTLKIGGNRVDMSNIIQGIEACRAGVIAIGKALDPIIKAKRAEDIAQNPITVKTANRHGLFKRFLEEANGEELPSDNAYDEFVDRLAELGIESVIQEDAECDDRVQVWEGWGDDEIVYEAANIDDDMKEVIQTLNAKGYGTVYSCSGHPSARLKSDKLKDGIKYGKVYSTARVVFDKKYDFKDIPKYWEKKDLEDKIGIYVKGPTYNIVNGMREQQFEKWKKRYMYNLRQWADNLPAKDGSKPSKEEKENEKVLNEDVNEELTSMLNDLIMDGDAE
jgi:hypothetical protein